MRAWPRALVLGVLLAACGAPRVAEAPAPPTPAPPLAISPIAGPKEPRAEAQPPAAASEPEAAGESAAEVPRDAPAEAPEDEPGTPIATVAGMPLYAEDLLKEWHQIAGREVLLVIDKLVATRLAFAEAQRLGIRLAPEEVEKRLAAAKKDLEERVGSLGKGLSVDQYLKNELGVEPARYYERMRSATIRQMIAERAVRAWTLSNESVSLRLIVVPDEDEMRQVQAALAAGEDFAEVARAHSVDDTKEAGGYVPYIVREERSPLARLAFATAVGELGGPLPTADHLFLIEVEERHAPIAGDWSHVSAAVEESLARHGLSDSEFVHWKLAMEERYPVDMERLKELLGVEG